MCTAVSLGKGSFFFGRNLDVEFSFGERPAVMPELFPFVFRHIPTPEKHFAMAGMAHIAGGIPLFFDAVNEKGLYMAALEFPESARYLPQKSGMTNVASFEFIPFILGGCENLAGAKKLLEKVNITDDAFSPELPPSPLHWFIADESGAVSVEPRQNGIRVYENRIGILTNEPPFEFHMQELRRYSNLSPKIPEGIFSAEGILPFGGGGAFSLPGDFSSGSRFVRASYLRLCTPAAKDGAKALEQIFSLLGNLAQPEGCSEGKNGALRRTEYSSAADGKNGVYYFRSPENSRICGIRLSDCRDREKLRVFPFPREQDILFPGDEQASF